MVVCRFEALSQAPLVMWERCYDCHQLLSQVQQFTLQERDRVMKLLGGLLVVPPLTVTNCI